MNVLQTNTACESTDAACLCEAQNKENLLNQIQSSCGSEQGDSKPSIPTDHGRDTANTDDHHSGALRRAARLQRAKGSSGSDAVGLSGSHGHGHPVRQRRGAHGHAR